MSWVRMESGSAATYYDIGYAPIWNPALVADLIELLTQPDVQWFELEEALANAPREAQFARLLRANRARSSYPFEFSPQRIEFVVDEEACQILLHRLFPYATLLDTHLTPLEQAMQLHREGVDVVAFLGWLAALGDRTRSQISADVYSHAARCALQSWHDHYSLLRGAGRADEPAGQLLRAASAASGRRENLLRPDQAPSAAAPPPAKSHRRFWRLGRRSH